MCVAVQMRQTYGCLWKLDKKNNNSWDKNIAQDSHNEVGLLLKVMYTFAITQPI